MKRVVLGLVLAIPVAFTTLGQTTKGMPDQSSKAPVQKPIKPAEEKKTIKGATISPNKVVLKTGYEFLREGENQFAIRKKAAPGGKVAAVSGRFSCNCGEAGRTCHVVISPQAIQCDAGSCSHGCIVVVQVEH